MRKYIIVDERKYGDVFTKVLDTLEDANKEARYQWRYLTREERKRSHVFVGHVEDNEDYLYEWAFDEDGTVDYEAYHSLGTEYCYFDSSKEKE